MKLIGTCQSMTQGLEGPAVIECDPEFHEITVYFRHANRAELIEGKRILLKRFVRLYDIELASHSARFALAKLPPAIFTAMDMGGFSIDDGQIDKLLNLNNNDTGVLKLGIRLKTEKLAFTIVDVSPDKPLFEELVLSNHSRFMAEAFDITLGKRTFNIRYASKRLFVYGRVTEANKEVFRHTASLLALSAEFVVAHLRPPKVILNMYGSDTKGYGEEVIPRSGFSLAFEKIAQRLSSMPEPERNRTFHEITYVVSGFEQSRLLEERLTSLFKALESYDRCRTLSPQRCATLFGIKRDDAKYVCLVRNKLTHNGMALAEAGVSAFNDLSSNQKVKLERFSGIKSQRHLPWKLYATRRVGEAAD
jgi:hypothetical protein